MSDCLHRALQLLDGLKHEIERARAYQAWRDAGSKGMHVPFHGDFAGFNAVQLSRVEWWERALRDALSGRDPVRCVECGMPAATALCPEHAP